MEPNFTSDPESTDSNVHRLYSETHPRNVAAGESNWKVIVDRISSDFSTLYEREGLLIRAEINEKFTEVKNAATSMAVGGALCFAGLIAAVYAAVYVLDVFLPLWLSAVIVTAVFFLVGGVMIKLASSKLEASKLKPRHSIDTLSEIKSNLKERVNEFRH